MFTLGKDRRSGHEETFGINVFKVREVMHIPEITRSSEQHSSVEGMANLHGTMVPVIDLAKYIGIETDGKPEAMIVTGYNGQKQGFLVRAVGNILLLDWSAMRVPPAMLLEETDGLVTSITELKDGRLVMMLDAERVLAETGCFDNEEMVFKNVQSHGNESLSALNQISPTFDEMPAKLVREEEKPDVGDGNLAPVDARPVLMGSSKMEILLFSLGGNERFGINVRRIKEVCPAGNITRTPNMPAGVDGIVLLHGHVIPILNLASFIGLHPQERHRTMMVTEFNNHLLGFLVQRVERMIRVDCDLIRASEEIPSGNGALITAIAELEDGTRVSIVDIEHILAKAFGTAVVGNVEKVDSDRDLCVFFADDFVVARKKIAEVLERMGIRHIQAANGNEAWDRLREMAEIAQSKGTKLKQQIQVVLTDTEMPEMDGYALTQHIKSDSRFDGIPVVMHSSLTADANRALGQRAGVDYYVPEFDSMMLSSILRPLLC